MTTVFFVGDDGPGRAKALAAELMLHPAADVSRFDLASQLGDGLAAVMSPSLLGDQRVVVWRNAQALRKLAVQEQALLEQAVRRRSASVVLLAEMEAPAPRKGQQQPLVLPRPMEQWHPEIRRFDRPSPFDAAGQRSAVLELAKEIGLRLTADQADALLLRLGPNSDRLRPVLRILQAAAGEGPVTLALVQQLVEGHHLDATALFRALARRDRPKALQLAQQAEASGEGGVAVLRRLQQQAWQAVVLLSPGATTEKLGAALGISSGAAYYRRRDLNGIARPRAEQLLAAITQLAARQVGPGSLPVPLALQLQQLLAS